MYRSSYAGDWNCFPPPPGCTVTVAVSVALSYELTARDTTAKKPNIFYVPNKYVHTQYMPVYIFKHISATLLSIFYDPLNL